MTKAKFSRLERERAELLEALKEISIDRDTDMVWGTYADGWYAALYVCRNLARAAIAKAEGK